jgi:rhamnosyltransferase
MPRIFAVIVTYEPDQDTLTRLLLALAPQITGGIVVNNGCELPISDCDIQQMGFSIRHQQLNTGVATALNDGFQWAEAQNAEFIISFDQDSEPTAQMISLLMATYQNLKSNGHKIGAVGPQQVDRRTGKRAGFMAPISWQRYPVVPTSGEAVEVDHLITSGCLVPIAAWKCAGRFLDALFIDYVDIEWSLRLRYFGWHLFGVGGADLIHSIGDDIKPWCGWKIPWHNPLRHYFMIRNGLHLQKLSYIPLGWKLADGIYLFKRIILFIFLAKPRTPHLRAMLRGISDGWRGKLGNQKSMIRNDSI